MRTVLFAPTTRSLYSRLVADGLQRLSGVELVGVYVRRLWSYRRIRTDLRREGPRLLRKIYTKLILPEVGNARVKRPTSDPSDVQAPAFDTLRALSHDAGIPYFQVGDFNHEASEASLKQLAPDLVVFTGGGLIRKNILSIPTLGVLNCHSGLLPRYRGMDTLEWTLLESEGGLPQVGLTLHYMDAGVDTGPILRHYRTDILPGEDLDSVRRRLEAEMVHLVVEGVGAIQRGDLPSKPQELSDGRQYYVIHPRLREKAAQRLKMNA